MIHKADVTGLVLIDGVDLHVGGIGEGGYFVAHKPPEEGMDLIKGHLGVGHVDVDVVPHVRIPVVYPSDSFWSSVKF